VKVLVISSKFPPTLAPESAHAFHLCEHLAKHGLDVHLLTTKTDRFAITSLFTVHALMQGWAWRDLPGLARFIRRCSPDVILLIYLGWIYDHHPMITFAPTISRFVSRRIRFITQFENSLGANVASGRSRMIWRAIRYVVGKENVDAGFGTLLRDSDSVIFLSERHLEALESVFANTRVKSAVVPAPPTMHILPEENGLFRKRGRAKVKASDEDIVLIYFGYIYPLKGLESLLRAFEQVRAHKLNVKLLIVGGSINPHRNQYQTDLFALSKDLGIDEEIIWAGHCEPDKEDASVYMRAADICVLPFNDGVRLNNSSVAVASAHGLPIITTRGDALEPPFVHGANVFLCEPKDPKSLANAVERVIERSDLQARLRAGSLKLAREWFSWEKAIERTVATFNQVVR
jgi:glycosyltransferase involved in cell wall biosynthesis